MIIISIKRLNTKYAYLVSKIFSEPFNLKNYDSYLADIHNVEILLIILNSFESQVLKKGKKNKASLIVKKAFFLLEAFLHQKFYSKRKIKALSPNKRVADLLGISGLFLCKKLSSLPLTFIILFIFFKKNYTQSKTIPVKRGRHFVQLPISLSFVNGVHFITKALVKEAENEKSKRPFYFKLSKVLFRSLIKSEGGAYNKIVNNKLNLKRSFFLKNYALKDKDFTDLSKDYEQQPSYFNNNVPKTQAIISRITPNTRKGRLLNFKSFKCLGNNKSYTKPLDLSALF